MSIAVFHALRNNLLISISHKRLLLLTGIPLIILATTISLFKPVLPHWTGPAFSSIILLTAVYLAKNKNKPFTKAGRFPLPILAGAFFLLFVIVAGVTCVNYFPGTLGKNGALKMGEGDFTLDMYGWRKLAKSFDSIYKVNHSGSSQTIIVSNKWFPAAHIDFYVARPLHLKVFVTGPIEDIHQYHWINKQNNLIADSTEIFVIIPSNYYSAIKDYKFLKNKKPLVQYTISQVRNGKEARKFYIYYFSKDRYIFEE